ncbi:MAG: oligopeptide transport system substrate-binding protein [Chloroflexota bacterium]|nr:oligopeptide transport system substrate-binding protein [Chloroflexota bacterium]
MSDWKRSAAALVVLALVAACTSPTIPPSPTSATAPMPSATSRPTTTPTPTATPVEPSRSQILRLYCCATDPRSLRPQAASGSDEQSILNGLQRGLLYRDGEGRLVPSLATSLPTVSADGLTYTYSLRRDASYSDGTPIVAEDIVRAARDLADPRNAFDYGYEMCFVRGAYELLGRDFGCADGETPYADPEAGTFDDDTIEGLLDQLGVTAPDDHTVIFQLYQPTSFWPDITATWLLTPVPETQTSWVEAGDIVSSGPFVLSEWTHNSKIVLQPNPNWYGLAPTLQRIEISMGGDPVEAVAAWERGDLDEVRVPSSLIGQVWGQDDYRSMISRSNTSSLEYWDFATCQTAEPHMHTLCPPNEAVTEGIAGLSPMQNVQFRQVLTQAIDKADMIEVAFAGIGSPAFSPTMAGIPGFPTFNSDNTPLPFDPAAALIKLNTALGELGVAEPDPSDVAVATDECDVDCQQTKAWARMLGSMRFGYNCDAGHDPQVLYMAEQWRQVLGFTGDQFDVRCTDYGGFRPPRPRTSVYDVSRDGWGADFPHPDNQNRNLFTCGGHLNQSGYCNNAYEALLDQGAAAASYEASLQSYHLAEQLLVEDAPVLFLRYGESISLVRPWVTNYTQTPFDQQNVGDMFYETIQIVGV